MLSIIFSLQLDFKDPSKDWKIVNSWFVKQTDFYTNFSLRDIPKPEAGAVTEKEEVQEVAQ